jgi:hypothetical protein
MHLMLRPRVWIGLGLAAGAIAAYAVRRALRSRRGTDAIARLPCTSERDVRSQTSEVGMSLTFVNETTGRISIYWIDFDGGRVFYNSLEPGASYVQRTYVTHPWIAVDPSGRCLALLVPIAGGDHRVAITGAAYPRR